MKSRAKQIFWNAILLSAAALLIRTVGVSFQVYISNRAGAEAMGLFSLLSGVYGFALTLATSGVHLGVTRLVVDAIGEEKPYKVPAAMRRATLYALIFGLGAAFLLFSFSDVIGNYWLKDERTIRSLRLLSFTLPFISLSSAWSGYFTAVRRSYKNATVQVFEQAIKIFATMYLLTFFAVGSGVEETCCVLVLGGTIAETLSFLADLILYLCDKNKCFPKSRADIGGEGKKFLSITIPIALTTYVRSALLTLQHILIPEGLRQSGASHAAALVAYGTIQSMALPVILYPAALISSFSGLLIPELAESEIKKERIHISYMIRRVWSLALIFSIGVAGIMICFSQELGQVLYPNTDAGKYIHILAPLVPIMYVDTATDAMMKGLGEQVHSMKINIADALISVILVWLLIPRYGIGGYLFAVYFSEFFNTVCSVTHLLSISNTAVHPIKWVYKPLFCIVLSTVSARLFWSIPVFRLESGPLSLILHCASVLLLYLLSLRITSGIDKEDATWIKELLTPPTHRGRWLIKKCQ